MCGRYYIEADDTPEELRRLLEEAEERAGEPMPTGEIAPGRATAVVAASRTDRRPAAFAMRWGYPIEGGRLLINARSETAARKPMFADSLRARRCLIPASAWFEWDHRAKPPAKHRITPREERWFFLAGLYRLRGAADAEYTILTREAAGGLHDLHPRMPVALSADTAAAWLDPAADPERLILDSALTDTAWVPVREPGGAAQLSFLEA
ncbi:MAG: SOS response-associated peptidase [Clostridia bacterium]|nr:SOS response-associated peptidase [Clostridia bacterium]